MHRIGIQPLPSVVDLANWLHEIWNVPFDALGQGVLLLSTLFALRQQFPRWTVFLFASIGAASTRTRCQASPEIDGRSAPSSLVLLNCLADLILSLLLRVFELRLELDISLALRVDHIGRLQSLSLQPSDLRVHLLPSSFLGEYCGFIRLSSLWLSQFGFFIGTT